MDIFFNGILPESTLYSTGYSVRILEYSLTPFERKMDDEEEE